MADAAGLAPVSSAAPVSSQGPHSVGARPEKPRAAQSICEGRCAARGRQPDRSPSSWSANPGDNQLISFTEAVPAVKRSLWLIAGCVFATTALGAAYVIATPPSYAASAQLLIGSTKLHLLSPDSNVVDLSTDSAEVESQVEVLRSERIAKDVVASLDLGNDPEFRGSRIGADHERQRIALTRFHDKLSVRRIGQSNVVEVSFRSRDPETAPRIANAITAAYIRDQFQAKADAAHQASLWMEERVAKLGVQLNAAASAVQQFRTANGIIDNNNTVSSQPRLIDKLTELEARAEAYRKLYEGFLRKLTEDQEQGSYPVPNARIITEASTPLAKSAPKTKLVLLLSVLLGLVIGVAVSAVRSILDTTVRSGRQIERAVGIDCLATLPDLRPGCDVHANAPYDEVLAAPNSRFAEAIRSVTISLRNSAPDGAPIRLGLFSLLPGEGASTLAASLATSFAASATETLLIDANFREPSLSRRFAPGAQRGLNGALRDGPDGTLVAVPNRGFHILPFGAASGARQAAELFGSEAMRQLLPQLSRRFATTIIDLPSSTHAVYARAFGPLLDGCILVAEWGRASLPDLQAAVDLMQADRVHVLGAIVNKAHTGVPPFFGFHLRSLRALGRAAYINRFIHEAPR
jgi:polysaccharide biosynthesis transport protein